MSILEHQATQGKVASDFLSQMINGGHVVQDTAETIVLNAATGQHRFGVNAPSDQQADQ